MTFFGLTQEYKLDVHQGIFNMVTFGEGGWTWSELYNMPVFLRTFYMNKMAELMEKRDKATPKTAAKRPNIPR